MFENLALGEDGSVNFPILEKGSGVSSALANATTPTSKVRSKSVRTILNDDGLNTPYLLDLDVKGAEFTVINDSSIAEFKKVRIE